MDFYNNDEQSLGMESVPGPLAFAAEDQLCEHEDSHDEGVIADGFEEPVFRSVAGPLAYEEHDFGYGPQSVEQDLWEQAGYGSSSQPTALGSIKSSSTAQLSKGMEKLGVSGSLAGDVTSSIREQLVEQEQVVTAQAEPAYVEPWTSFLSNSLPKDVLHAVADILDKHEGVDHEVEAHSASVNGIAATSDGSGVVFRVQVWERAPGKMLVEVQRRRGCVVSFHQLYKQLVAALGAHVTCQLSEDKKNKDKKQQQQKPKEETTSTPSKSTHSHTATVAPGTTVPKHLDDCPMGMEAVTLDKSTVECMLGMGVEGLKVLAGMACMPQNQEVLKSNSDAVLQALMANLQFSGEPCRVASNLLAKLTESGALVMDDKCVDAVVRGIVDMPANLYSRGSRRQCAKALSGVSLGSSHRSSLEGCLGDSPDPRFCKIVRELL